MISRSSISRLLNATSGDRRKALGEDRVAIVRGRRRSALKYLHKELLDNREDDCRELNGKSIVCGGGWIPSLERKRKGRRPLVTFQTTASQTHPYRRVLPPQSAHNDKRLPTLSCQPRDIQLTPPIHVAEVSRPGARFSREGKLTQTPVYLAGPDLLPFTAVLDNLGDEEENRSATPNIQLNLWAADHLREQDEEERDSEWLEMNSNDVEVNEKLSMDGDKAQGGKNGNHYIDELMKSLGLLFLVMKIGGRWPFLTRDEGGRTSFQLKRRSWPYGTFLLTCIVHFFVTAISIFHTFTFLYSGESEGSEYEAPAYLQVQRLEFDKYWQYAFWTYITALFVCTWNLILLVDGSPIRDLLNRWLLAVTKMQYEPTADIRMLTIWSGSSFTLYAIVLTICCFTDILPAVRGSAGVMGSLFFSSAFPRIRFSRNYYLVRVFGLLFHLYTVYAAEVAMIFLLTCLKLIQNSASNWTLRFAQRFQMFGKNRKSKPFKVITYHVGISLGQLSMEHQTITTFSRHTAAVFHAILNSYLLTMGLQMSLFIYRSLAFLLIPDQVQFKKLTNVEGLIGDSGDTVAYKDSEAQSHLTCFFVTGMVIGSWFTTSLALIKPGEVILRCSRIVTRYELIVCKDQSERSFVRNHSRN